MARGSEINIFFLTIIFVTSSVKSHLFQPFVFKFGDDVGSVVHTSEGIILPLVFETTKYIEVPPGMDVSYVEVKVNSLSSPKVDYDNITRKVTILFSLTQLKLAYYSISVKAVPNYDVA